MRAAILSPSDGFVPDGRRSFFAVFSPSWTSSMAVSRVNVTLPSSRRSDSNAQPSPIFSQTFAVNATILPCWKPAGTGTEMRSILLTPV